MGERTLSENRRDQIRALYVAEAGFQQVIHWFNHPEDYTANTTQFTRFADTSDYYDAGNATRFSSDISVPSGLLPILNDAGGAEVGHVTSIDLWRLR